MSYVIQNFNTHAPALKTSTKVKASLLARNAVVIRSLIFTTSPSLTYLASTLGIYRPLHISATSYFTKLIPTLFASLRNVRYVPIGSNLPRTAYYATLKALTSNSTGRVYREPLSANPLRTLLNPYFTGVPVHTAPVTKKAFLGALHKLLQMSLSVWSGWSGQYRKTSSHFYIGSSYQPLRFLNSYYFKIYNL